MPTNQTIDTHWDRSGILQLFQIAVEPNDFGALTIIGLRSSICLESHPIFIRDFSLCTMRKTSQRVNTVYRFARDMDCPIHFPGSKTTECKGEVGMGEVCHGR